MSNSKTSPISFGITLTSAKQTRTRNSNRDSGIAMNWRENTMPGKSKQMSAHEFDSSRREMPPQAKPFTPDMFNCEPGTLTAFSPPVKISPKVERIRKELERSRSRTAPHSPLGKSFSIALSVLWEIFTIICVGVFVALKYAFIAVAAIITIGCMLCAGRQTGGLK